MDRPLGGPPEPEWTNSSPWRAESGPDQGNSPTSRSPVLLTKGQFYPKECCRAILLTFHHFQVSRGTDLQS